MKKLIVQNDKCTGCGICMIACGTTYFNDESCETARLKVCETPEGAFDIQTCVQCDVCINICPVNALYRNNDDVVMLDKELCVNCMMCVGFCPHGVMIYSEKCATPFKCVLCGVCAKNCPTGALELKAK